MSIPLRSFKAFTNVAPVSPSIPIDAAGVLTRQVLFGCNLVNFDGITAAAGYFQVFDLAVAPTTGVTVPLKSIRIEDDGSGGPQPIPSFLPSLGPVTLRKGLYFAMSSTEAVYTAVATNFDVWGEIGEFELLQPDTLTSTSSGASNSFPVWATADGPKKLVELQLTAGSTWTAVAYLLLFAKANPQPTDKAIASWPLYDVNNANAPVALPFVLKFGNDGLDVESQSAAYVRSKGCTFGISTTPSLFTVDSGASVNFTAYYK